MYPVINCPKCGKELAENAIMCPNCGSPMNTAPLKNANDSDRDWLTAVLLCFFLGGIGVHSFYAGKTGIGIAQLLTLGGCGIWALIDFIMILCGNYKDAEGKLIVNKR